MNRDKSLVQRWPAFARRVDRKEQAITDPVRNDR